MAKVNAVHFLRTHCPGLPIYEMEGGELLMPYYNKQYNQYFWFAESEMISGEKDEKKIAEYKAPYIAAKRAIIIERQQKIMGKRGKEIPIGGKQPSAEA